MFFNALIAHDIVTIDRPDVVKAQLFEQCLGTTMRNMFFGTLEQPLLLAGTPENTFFPPSRRRVKVYRKVAAPDGC